jgi:6-phosphogluconolactonase (cycloisomerase 2 family)
MAMPSRLLTVLQSLRLHRSAKALVAAAMVNLLLVPAVHAADPPPLRVITDPNPNFGGVWVDTTNNELIVSDDDKHSVIVYSRTASGAATPLRQIQGGHTLIDFPASAIVDTVNNEIWSAMNDTSERAVAHSRTANGNVAPLRFIDLATILGASSNRAWGWSVDATNNEVMGSFQSRESVSVFDRTLGTLSREITGTSTGLNDPHGNALDLVNNEIFVTNEGHIKGSPLVPPSITVYSRTASGNVAPLRTVTGSSTGLNVPKHISVDTTNNEMAVANGGGDSITVYTRAANGNVAPLRTITGSLTGLNHPTGVSIDAVNNEIAVTNWGNHTVTVFSRTANGNVAPLRTITTTPGGAQVGIGNPGAMSVDLTNNEIAVNNCVSHPRLAVFNRTDNGQVAPKRVLEGANTHISRSTHGVWIDTVNNEIAMPSGMENAILIFDRLAAGNTAPKRIIQGSNTLIQSASKGIMIDTVNNEIVMPSGSDANTALQKVSVWDRLANGNVAPKREFNSEDFNVGGESPVGIWVDATNNEIWVAEGSNPYKILVFDRLATGTVTALRSITGTSTMLDHPRQIALDLIHQEIFVTNNGDRASDPPVFGSVTVYNRLDNGNVAPKRFIQQVIQSQVISPRSMWLDTVNNEIGVGDSKTNQISVFPRDWSAATSTPTATATPAAATSTPTATATATPVPPTSTPTATATPSGPTKTPTPTATKKPHP